MLDTIYIIVGLILLVLGGDWLLKSSVSISLKLNISKIVIGLTVVSFATSAPELIISVKSALDGFSDIALGNVVGSNIANVGLVLGAVLLINAVNVERSFYITDWPMKILASFLLFGFLVFNKDISRGEGIFFLLLLVIFVVYIIKKNKQITTELPSGTEKILPNHFIVLFMFLGGFALWAGSELLVKGAVNLAESFGVSERIIAVTVVSVGTSIPELASSIIAAIKKEADISIGNIIGSNIFNILCVLGITAIIKPIENIDEKMLSQDIYWMLGFALLLMPLVILPKRGSLFFKEGILLLVAYAAFLYFTLT
jgi:cation:H+ antiporter